MEKEEKPKKEEKEEKKEKKVAIVKCVNLPISLKYSVAICKFIKNKDPKKSIELLKKVIDKKIAVPMTGEIPHKKGKGMAGGRYPGKASLYFIKALKGVISNASVKDLDVENLKVSIAMANKGETWQRPTRRPGAVNFKRTNLLIQVEETAEKGKKQKREKPKQKDKNKVEEKKEENKEQDEKKNKESEKEIPKQLTQEKTVEKENKEK